MEWEKVNWPKEKSGWHILSASNCGNDNCVIACDDPTERIPSGTFFVVSFVLQQEKMNAKQTTTIPSTIVPFSVPPVSMLFFLLLLIQFFFMFVIIILKLMHRNQILKHTEYASFCARTWSWNRAEAKKGNQLKLRKEKANTKKWNENH